ncbi:MAG: hypothetical protein AB7F19_04945 [Candidatus Babeliales bacterium]
MVTEAKSVSKALNRSVAGQIEHWAKIGNKNEPVRLPISC